MLEEVVVTAQKRQESINSVPMTINAVSGEQLLAQGIHSVGDLAKIAPGFHYTPSPYSTPIYSIRGIGFNESSLGAKPNVSVYVDEVPLAFPIVTAGVALDLERVEILKGPQGTLFGQNSTGGAINYIAAKPTNQLEAGVNAEYGRFNEANLEGFVSGAVQRERAWPHCGQERATRRLARELHDGRRVGRQGQAIGTCATGVDTDRCIKSAAHSERLSRQVGQPGGTAHCGHPARAQPHPLDSRDRGLSVVAARFTRGGLGAGRQLRT